MEPKTPPTRPVNDDEWMAIQIKTFGPLLGGAQLRAFLGFRSQAAFAKARAGGTVGIPTFGIPGRKGVFAFTADACSWALALRRQASH